VIVRNADSIEPRRVASLAHQPRYAPYQPDGFVQRWQLDNALWSGLSPEAREQASRALHVLAVLVPKLLEHHPFLSRNPPQVERNL